LRRNNSASVEATVPSTVRSNHHIHHLIAEQKS